MSDRITTTSECPYCGNMNPRVVRRVLGSYRGNHHCEVCGQQYTEHYRLELTLNTYPIAEKYREIHRA